MKKDAEELAAGDPVWFDWRPFPNGFGVTCVENQVVQVATAPSENAVEVDAATPLHDWQPGRQWIPGCGPDGVAPGGAAALIAPADGSGIRGAGGGHGGNS